MTPKALSPAVRRWIAPLLLAAAMLVTAGHVGSRDVTGSVAEPFLMSLGLSHDAAVAAHYAIRKVGHFTAYALFAFLALRALSSGSKRGGKSAGWREGLGAAAVSIFLAGCDEAIQRLSPDRTPSFVDVGIDSAGAISAILAALAWNARRSAATEPTSARG